MGCGLVDHVLMRAEAPQLVPDSAKKVQQVNPDGGANVYHVQTINGLVADQEKPRPPLLESKSTALGFGN
ncbi:MAG: hypothetical protein L6R42_008040 [Xanthoria sp. 1 TBL-2021]|nr:MAG: hypothetical protein L6R42_008040 [Xanthoria sp. 1 TBL-2021]